MIDGIQPPKRDPKPRLKIEPIADEEPSFQPPEVVADQDDSTLPGAAATEQTPETPSWKQANVKKRRSFISLPNLSKKQAIIAGVVAALLICGGVGAFVLTRDKPAPAPAAPVVQKAAEPAKPTTVGSQLTGVQGPLDQNNQPVIGVMIENSPDARPQAGLNQAGVVFEAIAEGGITRFLALYQQDKPDYIGPVRSVRLYYIQWLQGFDAPIAHAGGAAEALNYIKAGNGVKDIDHGPNGNLFKRVSNRYAPHNLYSDVNKLSEHAKSKGWTKSDFNGFMRKGKEEPSATPNAKRINITISGPKYNVNYDYNPATNSYNRILGGLPHKDERSGVQLSPKVVIVMAVPYSIQSNGIHSDYKVTGSGKAFVFQDGIAKEAVWEKPDVTSQIRFGDVNGSPLAINPGQTWITAVGAASNVSFTP